MHQKIKNLFSYFNKLRNKLFFVCPAPKQSLWLGAVLFFVVLGLVFPKPASAQWGLLWEVAKWSFNIGKDLGGGGLLNASVNMLVMAFAVFFLSTPLVITQLALLISAGILGLVTGPTFISISYTNPAENPILDVGWGFTRDFANMGFVIALVFIGLGTALRLGEYQWQKTLPRLILIALLINFTPVLLGVIVDASNIIMHAFLQDGINFDSMLTIWTRLFKDVQDALLNITTDIKGEVIGRIVALIFFGAIASATLLVYSVLFILRYLAIWMLIILSPIAFLCYILPTTRRYWSMWWNQFIQWCFIGVFAGFFLYLTTQLLKNPPALQQIPKGDSVPISGLLNDLLPFGIVIGFLIIGLFTALSTSAMGASGVISIAQKGTKTIGAKATKYAGGVARGIPVVSRTEERLRRRMEEIPVVGGLVGGVGAYERERSRRIQELGRPYEKLPPQEIRRAFQQRPATYADRLKQARLYEILADMGELGTGNPEQTQREIAFAQTAQQYGIDPNKIYEKRPDWTIARPHETQEQAIRRSVERIEPDTFRKIQIEALQTPPPPGSPPGTAPTYTDENLAVFYAMDMRKAVDLGLRGKKNKKDAVRNLAIAREHEIATQIAALRATGNPDDAERAEKIENVWIHVVNHANYIT